MDRKAGIEELIALFAIGRCAVIRANPLDIRRGDSVIRLRDGRVWGPERDGDTITDEFFANILIRDFARSYRFDVGVPPGVYFRWTNTPDEPGLARDRTLRTSHNFSGDRPENGFSVAEGPWFYCLTHNFCWLVRGKEIGRGSDNEPLLDVGSLEVVQDVMPRHDVLTLVHDRNWNRIVEVSNETGVSPIECSPS